MESPVIGKNIPVEMTGAANGLSIIGYEDSPLQIITASMAV